MSTLTPPWAKPLTVAFVPGPLSALLDEVANQVLEACRRVGHTVVDVPVPHTDLLWTTAPFGHAVRWREALLFTARRRFSLERTPTILTMIHAPERDFYRLVAHFERALQKNPLDPADFAFEGLQPGAYEILAEQGRRGGPILILERLLQVQSKSIRILLLVGDRAVREAYLFDLVGAHPRLLPEPDEQAFYLDIALRVTSAISSASVTDHQVVGDPVPADLWRQLAVPRQMIQAARELGKRHFFTPTVRIADLVAVPSISNAVAEQYSEGCFATWEPHLSGLVSTITGSARPVDKGSITLDDLAIIVGVRPDGRGALVRHVVGHRNDPPSSEAVEMIWMDEPLPRISLSLNGQTFLVPAVRSKLHGHRGVAAYHPDFVEYVPLDTPYYYYPVSCSTEAQARGIYQAFSRAECLRYPQDPRQVAFTILPGHGVVIVEKWQSEKAPFQVIWEYLDAGYLEIQPRVPQGPLMFVPGPDGRLYLCDLMKTSHLE